MPEVGDMERAGTEILHESLLGSWQQHRPCSLQHAWCWDIRPCFKPYLGMSTFQLSGLEQAFASLHLLLSLGSFASPC